MSAVVLALGLAMGTSAGAEAFPQPQIRIDVTVFKGDPFGSKAEGTVEVLSRPQVQVRPGQTGFVQVGQQFPFPVANGAEINYRHVGLTLRFTPQFQADGTVQLKLESEVSKPVPTPIDLGNGKTAIAFNTQTLTHNRAVKDTQTVRVGLAADSVTDQTWAELTVHIVRP